MTTEELKKVPPLSPEMFDILERLNEIAGRLESTVTHLSEATDSESVND